MFLKQQLLYALAMLCTALLCHVIHAEETNQDNAISSLYDNLLQREYAGPVVFPNHQVERKAQRSPSLRLRFGRRSDPYMMPHIAEKRWFGDVDQKPIRSPSLRLRFGRRSDPAVPLQSRFDALLNDLVEDNAMSDDYADAFEGYERVVRKPQRLRWGRSVPFESDVNNFDEENERSQQLQQRREDAFYNSLMNSDKLRNMLLSLQQYDGENMIAASNSAAEANENDDSLDEFQRGIRKSAPLRLRWGRSTGGRSSAATTADTSAKNQEKKAISANAVNTEKLQIQHEQDKN